MLPIPTSCFLSDELEILIKAEPLIQGCLWVDDNFDVEGQENLHAVNLVNVANPHLLLRAQSLGPSMSD